MGNKLTLQFDVSGMKIKRVNYPPLAEGSYKFIEAKFTFSDEWNGASKFMLIARNNETYTVEITNNVAEVEYEAVRTAGRFDLAVVGEVGDTVITSLPVTVYVNSTDFANNPAGSETRLTNDFLVTTLNTVKGYAESTEYNSKNVNVFIPEFEGTVLKWTNAKGLPNPAPINLKGADGQPGQQGLPGRDGVDGRDAEIPPELIAQVADNAEDIAELQATAISQYADIATQKQRLEWLEKLSKGILYDFSTDSTVAFTKSIPSGAKTMDVKSISGRSWVLNQLANPTDVTKSAAGITTTIVNCKITHSGTCTGAFNANLQENIPIVSGHKYALIDLGTKYPINSNGYPALQIYGASTISLNTIENGTSNIVIGTATGSGVATLRHRFQQDATYNLEYYPMLIDLTQAGLDSLSVAELGQIFTEYIPYNAGELKAQYANKVTLKGKNLVNPANTIEGYINDGNGAFTAISNHTSLDYTEVSPSTKYYIAPALSSGNWGAWYDSEKTFISGITGYNKVVTSPNNAKYIRLTINRSGNNPNWQDNFIVAQSATATDYTPYKAPTIFTLPQYCSVGKSAGSVADECQYYSVKQSDGTYKYYAKVITRVGSVDLGSLSYSKYTVTEGTLFRAVKSTNAKAHSMASTVANLLNAKYNVVASNSRADKTISDNGAGKWDIIDNSYTDANTFKSAMSGVILYYELATPTETIYELDENIVEALTVEGGGSVTIYDNTSDYKIGVPSTEEYLIALNEV